MTYSSSRRVSPRSLIAVRRSTGRRPEACSLPVERQEPTHQLERQQAPLGDQGLGLEGRGALERALQGVGVELGDVVRAGAERTELVGELAELRGQAGPDVAVDL